MSEEALYDRIKSMITNESYRIVPWIIGMVAPQFALAASLAVATYSFARYIARGRFKKDMNIDEIIDAYRLQIIEIDMKLKSVSDEKIRQVLLSERKALVEVLRRFVKVKELIDFLRLRYPKVAKEIEKFLSKPDNLSRFVSTLKKTSEEVLKVRMKDEEFLSRVDRLVDDVLRQIKRGGF